MPRRTFYMLMLAAMLADSGCENSSSTQSNDELLSDEQQIFVDKVEAAIALDGKVEYDFSELSPIIDDTSDTEIRSDFVHTVERDISGGVPAAVVSRNTGEVIRVLYMR